MSTTYIPTILQEGRSVTASVKVPAVAFADNTRIRFRVHRAVALDDTLGLTLGDDEGDTLGKRCGLAFGERGGGGGGRKGGTPGDTPGDTLGDKLSGVRVSASK